MSMTDLQSSSIQGQVTDRKQVRSHLEYSTPEILFSKQITWFTWVTLFSVEKLCKITVASKSENSFSLGIVTNSELYITAQTPIVPWRLIHTILITRNKAPHFLFTPTYLELHKIWKPARNLVSCCRVFKKIVCLRAISGHIPIPPPRLFRQELTCINSTGDAIPFKYSFLPHPLPITFAPVISYQQLMCQQCYISPRPRSLRSLFISCFFPCYTSRWI